MFFSRMTRCKSGGKLIVGLGNPEAAYSLTRHNAGAQAVRRFAKDNKFSFKKSCSYKSFFAQGKVAGETVVLLLPQTYMNLSGEAIAAYLKKKPLSLKDILVVYDDVALPLGQIRLKAGGSAGGHNGLMNVIERLASEDFARLRIGIGGKGFDNLSDYVLSKFNADEKMALNKVLDAASGAIKAWISENIDKAMNCYNIKRKW